MKQRSTQSSWRNEQCETVNLTEVSSVKPVKIHLVVDQQVVTQETTQVFTPKLTACGANTHYNKYCNQ